MRYRVEREWPASGGARMIPARTVVDTDSQAWAFLDGIVPEWNVTPLDQQTRDWLVAAYYGYPFTIPPVGT